MKIKKLIMILLIVAATTSYADERTDTIKNINKIIDNSIAKAIENDKTNPYINEKSINDVKNQILAAIKKELDEPGLTRLDIPDIIPKIDETIRKIGDGIGSKNNFRIIQASKEAIQPIERTAYEAFLRVVDAQNKMNGKESNYWEKGSVKAQRLNDGVDLVPIAHEVYTEIDSKREVPASTSKVNRNSTPIADLAEKGTGAFSKEYYSELPYQNSDQFYGKRFYFGAGNTVKDIVFLDKEKFSSELKKNEKNTKYYIEGEYKLATSNATEDERAKSFGAEKDVNPLDITMKEYRTRIQGKSKAEISAFLKEKMEQKNIKNIIQEGEDLYTVDYKGRKWKVYWNLEPVSIEKPLGTGSDSKMEYKDSVFTTINYYSQFDDSSTTDNRGKLLYTKDGSIYAQDKNKYNNDVSFKLTETETKVETKIKKMVKVSKNDYGPYEPISEADFNAHPEYKDSSKYDFHYDEDDEMYYVSKITRVSQEFESTDTEGITNFKKYAVGITEENFDKTISETVKVNKDVTKNLDEFIKVAKERAEKGEAPRNQIDQYFSDKKKLSKEEFENKWVKPFQNDEYIKAKENYEKELAEATLKRDNAKKDQDKYTAMTDSLRDQVTQNIGSGVVSYWDFYENFDVTKPLISEAKLEEYIKSKSEINTEEKKQLVREYYKAQKKWQEATNIYYTYNTEVTSGIAKKYGFWDDPSATAEQKKYLGLDYGLIRDLNLTRTIAGKNIEFRGIGRIEGTVDLGEGKNKLTITEQITGKYGTNITLGAYAKLKNIDTVVVGRALTNDLSRSSLSGKTSLRMDIDPTKKNTEGHYYQHALKDSDPNIIFRSIDSEGGNMDKRNDFVIELLTSKISDNHAIIDMGRKIDYTWHDMVTGKDYDMTIPFVSDSIAHQLTNSKKLSKNGTSLLELKTREELRRLNADENAVYRSIRNANKLGVLAPTLTTENKKTTFNTVDEEKEAKKKKDLITYLKTKSDNELINDLSQFNLSTEEKNEALSLIKNLKASDDFKAILNNEKQLKAKLEEIDKIEKDSNYQKLGFEGLSESVKNNFGNISNNIYSSFNNGTTLEKSLGVDLDRTDSFEIIQKAILLGDKVPELQNKMNSIRTELKNSLNNFEANLRKDLETVKALKAKYPNSKFDEIEKTINKILADDKVKTVLSRNLNDNTDLAALIGDYKVLLSNISLQLNARKTTEDDLEKNDASIENPRYVDYHRLKSKIFYTMREEEVLSELKNMLNQLSDRNIYSKLNKISKNEISTYTTIPFEVTHALTDKKNIARGGFISNRTVQDNFKGNIYTAYGLYETTANSNTKYGILFGGANTKHNEVYQRSLTTVATESEIKGVSAYVGGYFNKPVVNNLNWITGIGTQYGRYKVKREMRNNYQDLHSKGKVNTTSLNTYSGLIMNYPIQEDVYVQLKALLAYTMIKQDKIKESGELPLNINAKTYHYVDGEAGISFNKIFYGEDLRSSISAGAYGILGISGYRNSDLEGKIDRSSSSFGIKGDRIKKDAVKIHLDYNVQTDAGYTYGLEGTYITNSKENNVKIGIKGGYTF
ncbi:autotransporter domain-containing protein [Fusobacterium simiae]|uniref:autotransporter outer membrane beta-barrel domain-containing protein n=1 Tax=Fusobacterium TaxID=848 RepID=UPI00042498B0|nr:MULTISPECIES: autotransporter domain-containing protein [Fusobacterium]MDC7954828.1 autotransporter domain-containing protein [Fusobacterium simiae]